MKPAARLTDLHECPMPTPKPHVGGPIIPMCSMTVRIDGLAAARASDRAQCQVPAVNFIVTGSGSVQFDGLPAARMGDRTMHPPPGKITEGSLDVLIGGPTVGIFLGAAGGTGACTSAASGRKSKKTGQSYQNCGVESARQIINQTRRRPVSEDKLLNVAMKEGWADKEAKRKDSGGTSPAGREKILDHYGVPSGQMPANLGDLQQMLAERRGVITSHDAGKLWGDKKYLGSGHAILVTGVDYGPDGKATTIHYNDTGTGTCGATLPADKFVKSLRPGRDMNVTDAPIW